jgi:lysozyme
VTYSLECVALAKEMEGLRLSPYKDVGGRPTIGWGHAVGVTMKDDPITIEEAERLLRHDLDEACKVVLTRVKAPMLTQGIVDACTDFCFNLGSARFTEANCTLLRKLNAGDLAGASLEFLRWTKATVDGKLVELPGLVRRRKAERALFDS